MTTRTRGVWGLLLALPVALAAAGCREEGPAEKAGRRIDDALERLREGDEGPLERAGREMDQTVEALREEAERLRRELDALREEAEERLE